MIMETVVSSKATLLLIAAKTLLLILILAMFIGIYLWTKAEEKLQNEISSVFGYEYRLEPHLLGWLY